MKKTIHYCWFGGNPLPQSAIRCIDSWKKNCPDYEIKEWNERNFDVNSCSYSQEAYGAKKWAFVSDYARFKILYEEGGIYFDTDVELIRPIDDIVELGAFMGNETTGRINVAPGLGIGAERHMWFLNDIIKEYEKKHFVLNDGMLDQTTVVELTTKMLEKHGLRVTETVQCIAGFNIYPSEYFCPFNFQTKELQITSNTRSIHHYDSSWYGERELHSQIVKERLSRFLPNRSAGHLAAFITRLKFDGIEKTVKSYRNSLRK